MATPSQRPTPRLFDPGSWPEASRIATILRAETVGGVLLVGAAIIALVWANSPWSDAYTALSGLRVGPSAWHLDLTLAQWAADGLLAIFFFVAGLELKREFVAGDLRDPRRAALPVAAAVGGMVAPAVVYVGFNVGVEGGALAGWAVPTATDIAFALAVLAVISTHLPAALRTFLLTVAVVDDLLAITIIAVFYTDSLKVVPLLAVLIPLALFAVLVQRRVRSGWLLLPPAAATWVLVHESGVQATVAGVLLGFTVPVIRRSAGPGPGLAEHFEHRWRPLSTGLAVPVFAFFACLAHRGGWARRQPDRLDHPRHHRRSPRGQNCWRARLHLSGPAIHPRPTRRGPQLVGCPRPGLPRRDRVHRVPAHRRARLRRRHPTGRPRQDRGPGRVSTVRAARRRRTAHPQPALPPTRGRAGPRP